MSASHPPPFPLFFFFNDTATTEIYTLSLHDALPISRRAPCVRHCARRGPRMHCAPPGTAQRSRSEEHTSELQSQSNLVCRLLLEKKKIAPIATPMTEISTRLTLRQHAASIAALTTVS